MSKPKFRLPSWTVLVVSLGIAIITAANILTLQRWADKSYKAEVLLLKISRELNHISALEWEAIATKEIEPELVQEIKNRRKYVSEIIISLNNYKLNYENLTQLIELYKQYNKALDKELNLILTKQIELAIQVDEDEVDPTFNSLSDEINRLSNLYVYEKNNADQMSDIGIIVALLLAAGALGILFWSFNAFLIAQTQKLQQALDELQQTQNQLIQSEKMASLGEIVAGIAHEINNPVSFIYGNLPHIKQYIEDLISLVNLYQHNYPESTPEIKKLIKNIDLEFIIKDLEKIISSMNNGTERISKIVLSLRNFSRLDESEVKEVDLHSGIESTLLILNSRLLNQIEIIKKYGELPRIKCFPALLNQVFMHILSNAVDAVLSQESLIHKQIVIETKKLTQDKICIQIRDNGSGIPPEIQSKIFDPFFTTKPVGKGTGLGLAVAYKIIDKHKGKITLNSEVAKGSEFTIILPIRYNFPE
ncbi:putative sensor protein [Calothrix sp. NIES-2100]|uniref:sensor histidine kinase n=1 Tax=Calothrix sp. NIES-2100 TaxID=1954172 RepID=UPI000B61F1A9|nr:putative sensor protein [Calothrix sp. NIES-2100]